MTTNDPSVAAPQLAQILKQSFPWLGTDDPADGGDTVEELSDLYESLSTTKPDTLPFFTRSEVATILHALREVQSEMHESGEPLEGIHFDGQDITPLTESQIDDLCEKINFDLNTPPVTGKVTLFVLAWDTDDGTGARIHKTEREAELDLIGIVTEQDTDERKEALRLLDEDEGNLWDYLHDNCFDMLDTYQIEGQEIELPFPGAIA
jgi:hypothetical protein